MEAVVKRRKPQLSSGKAGQRRWIEYITTQSRLEIFYICSFICILGEIYVDIWEFLCFFFLLFQKKKKDFYILLLEKWRKRSEFVLFPWMVLLLLCNINLFRKKIF